MKRIEQRISCVAALLLIGSLPLFAARSETPRVEPTLETILELAGDWLRVDENGEATEEVVSSFRVTAGGNAVLETLFPGTEKEMITIYTRDGEDLVLTHYCVMGNAPSYKARAGESKDELVYECVGGANLKSEDDAHMHEGRLVRHDENRLSTRWLMQEKGETTYKAEFELVRAKR